MAAQFALAGFQLLSGLAAADSIKKTAQLNQDIAAMNAQFAELDAYDAVNDGFSEIARYQSVVDSTLSEQTANLAAADVDISYGSAGEIQKETRFIAEMNKMEISKRAEEKALGYKREARDIRVGSYMNKLQSKQQVTSARIGAVTSATSSAISGYRNR